MSSLAAAPPLEARTPRVVALQRCSPPTPPCIQRPFARTPLLGAALVPPLHHQAHRHRRVPGLPPPIAMSAGFPAPPPPAPASLRPPPCTATSTVDHQHSPAVPCLSVSLCTTPPHGRACLTK